MGKVKKENLEQKTVAGSYTDSVPDPSEIRVKRYIPTYLPRGPLPHSENPYLTPGSKQGQKAVKRAELRSKIEKWYNEMSLKTAFSMYVTFFILLALLLSSLSMSVFSSLRNDLIGQYAYELGDDYVIDYISPDGRVEFYNPFFDHYVSYTMTPVDKTVSDLLASLSFLSIPVLFITCILLAGRIFFNNRLRKPMKILDEASRLISEKDLDFSISYERRDEMGRLCDSFEHMRTTLLKNNNEMWRQMEERRRLNSAFSHDLRTPLTVLKGNAHMLKEYLPQGTVSDEKMENTISTMENHIGRLENYVEIMSRLQKLEDIDINRASIRRKDFVEMLRNTADILCENLTLNFFDEINVDTLYLDAEVIIPVAENLISNASRYAKQRIDVVCSYSDNTLGIAVSDDGDGFSESELEFVTNPFYKAKKNIFDAHFGLGLNISKILTERHGGSLLVSNVQSGGALVKATFSEHA